MRNRFLHPFLFTVFPVLALFAHNLLPVQSFTLVLGPLAVSLSVVLLVFIVLRRKLHDAHKAAIVTTFFSLFFFSYGHLIAFLKKALPFVASAGPATRHLLALVFGIGFLVLLARFLFRKVTNLSVLTGFLNVVSVAALAQPVYQLAKEEIKVSGIQKDFENKPSAIKYNAAKTTALPDIYYILMDGYGRADVLQEEYGYDNSAFLNYLLSKGFYVADCSRSNYTHTIFSQAATLNMQYVDRLKLVKEKTNLKQYSHALFYNEVFRFVRQLGYKTVSFDAALFNHVEITSTDIFYQTPSLSAFAFHDFHRQLISYTPLRIVQNRIESNRNKFYDLHRQKILHGFGKLTEAHKNTAPVFVYAHFLAPHAPHVFGAAGEPVNPSLASVTGLAGTDTAARNSYRRSYRDEIHFLNTLLRKSIDSILAVSARPPVIILQSDHGPDAGNHVISVAQSNTRERLGNLFAVYLPSADTSQLYQTITPVNTFRVVFNNCFDTSLPLLPDKSFYSTHKARFDFIEIPQNDCRQSKPGQ